MKTKIIMLGLILLTLIFCEKGIENPYSPEPPSPACVLAYDKNANFYIDPNDSSKAEWRISGRLSNSGDLPAKNININSKIYDDSWNILWSGSFLFINPRTNSSFLSGGESCDFAVSWEGLDSNIFNEWDPTKTYGAGVTITWEDYGS